MTQFSGSPPLSSVLGNNRPWAVHRLDRYLGTSWSVLSVGRRAVAFLKLMPRSSGSKYIIDITHVRIHMYK